MTSKALRELEEVLDDLDTLLKNVDVGAQLADRGVNVSLALVARDALRAYLLGDRARAADDFGLVAEEITGRLRLLKDLPV
jgi:hypothetical protein